MDTFQQNQVFNQDEQFMTPVKQHAPSFGYGNSSSPAYSSPQTVANLDDFSPDQFNLKQSFKTPQRGLKYRQQQQPIYPALGSSPPEPQQSFDLQFNQGFNEGFMDESPKPRVSPRQLELQARQMQFRQQQFDPRYMELRRGSYQLPNAASFPNKVRSRSWVEPVPMHQGVHQQHQQMHQQMHPQHQQMHRQRMHPQHRQHQHQHQHQHHQHHQFSPQVGTQTPSPVSGTQMGTQMGTPPVHHMHHQHHRQPLSAPVSSPFTQPHRTALHHQGPSSAPVRKRTPRHGQDTDLRNETHRQKQHKIIQDQIARGELKLPLRPPPVAKKTTSVRSDHIKLPLQVRERPLTAEQKLMIQKTQEQQLNASFPPPKRTREQMEDVYPLSDPLNLSPLLNSDSFADILGDDFNLDIFNDPPKLQPSPNLPTSPQFVRITKLKKNKPKLKQNLRSPLPSSPPKFNLYTENKLKQKDIFSSKVFALACEKQKSINDKNSKVFEGVLEPYEPSKRQFNSTNSSLQFNINHRGFVSIDSITPPQEFSKQNEDLNDYFSGFDMAQKLLGDLSESESECEQTLQTPPRFSSLGNSDATTAFARTLSRAREGSGSTFLFPMESTPDKHAQMSSFMPLTPRAPLNFNNCFSTQTPPGAICYENEFYGTGMTPNEYGMR